MSASPSQPDASQRRRTLARSIWFTVPATYVIIAAAYAATSPFPNLDGASERLVFAVRWLVVAFLPYAAVCLVILHRRYYEGAHNPLLGIESERLAIHCRTMQNTLEQLVWFTLCLLPLATHLSSTQVRLVPILCVFFACARLLYWWGYLRNSTLGRAPGVQFTFTLNASLLVAVMGLFIGRHSS